MKTEIQKIKDMNVFGRNSKYYKYYTQLKNLAPDECLVFKFESDDELNKVRRVIELTFKKIIKTEFGDQFIIKFRKLHEEIGFIIIKQEREDYHWNFKKGKLSPEEENELKRLIPNLVK
tara:strand:- start:79 stop:435 length:357 start_codon:yes stop_codon:yes gene_type:complete